MTPALELLRETLAEGVHLALAPPDGLRYGGPPAALARLKPLLRDAKPALLEALRKPRRAAVAAWEAALGDIANRWDRHAEEARVRGEEPTWREDEAETLHIRHAINGARDAESLAVALEAVETWRGAWLDRLAPEPGSHG